MSLVCSEDRFLGGRITARQPKTGFRAGHDTVLLAAAVPAVTGDRLLELGSGAGIASLCLAARVPGVMVAGVEIDPELVRLANDNAARNGMAARVRFIAGDATAFAAADPFDAVFFNPPFHPESGQVSTQADRDRAKRDSEGAVIAWARVALAAVKGNGTLAAILRADRVDEMAAAATDHSVSVFPLFPRAGEPPKRVLVQIAKTGVPARRTLAGLVLHAADGRNTDAAEAVLRHAMPLNLDSQT